jgi:hypothetical protein
MFRFRNVVDRARRSRSIASAPQVGACVVGVLLMLASASMAAGQDLPSIVDDQEAQLWIQFNGQAPIARTWSLLFEGQPRWNQDVTHFDQAVLRTGVIKRLTPSIQLSAAYALVPRNTVLGTLWEQQSYEQVLLTLPRLGKWVPQLRLREDQRYLSQWADTSHRLRESLRFVRPLRTHEWTFVVYEEAFVNLDDTARGPSRGLDQLRLYSGLQHPITRDLAVEVGYMCQEMFHLGARPHRRNHNAVVQFQFRPGTFDRPHAAPAVIPIPAVPSQTDTH